MRMEMKSGGDLLVGDRSLLPTTDIVGAAWPASSSCSMSLASPIGASLESQGYCKRFKDYCCAEDCSLLLPHQPEDSMKDEGRFRP